MRCFLTRYFQIKWPRIDGFILENNLILRNIIFKSSLHEKVIYLFTSN